jgi:hypothetical protein
VFWRKDVLSVRVQLSEEDASAFLDGPSPSAAEHYFDSFLVSRNVEFDDSEVERILRERRANGRGDPE